MKKTIRLTENDLRRIVKRTLNESPVLFPWYGSLYEALKIMDHLGMSDSDIMDTVGRVLEHVRED